ncbi:MAG: phage tail sheath subtilisin-like domain-containing protein [Spirochaetales bacterium]|jgi:phage tail sheath protein FI|nr:phage tail sheath subtilisin-like domain-containing protein [Spirochaetales bacterium]
MREFSVPGVYVERGGYSESPLRLDGSCLAGFVGIAERGPLHAPVFVKSFDEYRGVFGGFTSAGVLPFSVYAFFQCGGRVCAVVRAANEKYARPASLRAECSGGGELVFEASSCGSWGNYISARLWNEKDLGGGESFSLILACGRKIETFLHLSLRPASTRYFESYINERSTLCRVRQEGAGGLPKPAFRLAAAGGRDGLAEMSSGDFTGSYTGPGQYRGLGAFEGLEDVSLIAAPDAHWFLETGSSSREENEEAFFRVQAALVTQAERFSGRFAVLDMPGGRDVSAALAWARRFDSAYAALYYPAIDLIDPLDPSGVKTLAVPPSGAVCGCIARTDAERGIFCAPANILLQGAAGASARPTEAEYELLYARGVNLLKYFPGAGIKIWGARTLSSSAEWKYINVRRAFSRISSVLKKGTLWAVFEPNTRELRKRVVRQVSGFLLDLWMKGFLAGASPEEAFYVRCDEELNPPEKSGAGFLTFEAGVAISRPLEFFKVCITAEKDGGGVYITEE